MKCMRCGRDTAESQVFCQTCLEKMERDPVEMEIVVQLPRRKAPAPPKKGSRRRGLSAEERIARLRRRVRRLSISLAVLAAALALLAGFTVYTLRSSRPRPGQNYKTLPSATAATVSTEAAVIPDAGR